MSQYASAAYCSTNFNSPGTQVKCVGGNCPLVEAADSATTLEYSKFVSLQSIKIGLSTDGSQRTETLTDVTGFVAVDHTDKLIVVSFRGSQSLDNWLTNLDFEFTDTDICNGCSAHSGFWQSWVDARDAVIPAVKVAVEQYPSYSVSITGHSLGGAIAPFAAAQLRNEGLKVALYTFGSPRIGGSAVSSYISNQAGGNYRVTHYNDPVPRVPLLTMGYVHVSPEYYIGTKNKVDVKGSDFQVIQGSINLFKGNAAWLITDVEAHRWYFTRMYDCGDGKRRRGLEDFERLEFIARF